MDFGAITAYYNMYGLMTYRHREMTTFLQWTMLDQVIHLISGCATLQGFLCVCHVLPSLYTHPNVWSSKMFNIFIISSLFGVWLCSPSKTKPLNSFRRLTTYWVKFVILLHIRTTACLADCQKCWWGWSLWQWHYVHGLDFFQIVLHQQPMMCLLKDTSALFVVSNRQASFFQSVSL